MAHILFYILRLITLVTWFSVNAYGEENRAQERQLFGGSDLLGLIPNYQDSSALGTNFGAQYTHQGVVQPYPFQSQIQYVPEIADRPVGGGNFLGQLGQYLQQGLLGQNPVGQYYPQYPGTQQAPSITEALTSIAKYDDLKCVPRLLCEVAAGGRPGYSGGKQGTGIPFINRDTLLSLMTVFNFGDSSPLMTFGRAILLGITAKGDPNTCFSAYPSCPRDQDHLVDYLNNHNGGFFKFFGTQQRPYYPQYHQGRIQSSSSHTNGKQQEPSNHRPSRGPKNIQFPNLYSGTVGQRRPPNVFQVSDFFKKENTGSKTQSLLFPSSENAFQDSGFFKKENSGPESSSLLFPSNGHKEKLSETTSYEVKEPPNSAGKTFYFPNNGNKAQTIVPNIYEVKRPASSSLKTFYYPSNGQTYDLNLFNKESANSAVKTFYFPSNGNKGQSLESNFFEVKESLDSPVKAFYYPGTESAVPTFHVERPPPDQKKPNSPMSFPDKTGTGDLRFDEGGDSIFNLRSVEGNKGKPNLAFAFDRSQGSNRGQTPENDERDKREKNASLKFPSKLQESLLENERKQTNGEQMKFPPDIIEELFGIE